MNRPKKNQHYVPQAYLERFCDRNGQIRVFDKAQKTTFAAAPRNIAAERYFYDFGDAVIDETFSDDDLRRQIESAIPEGITLEEVRQLMEGQFVEDWLSGIETRFIRARDSLLKELCVKRKRRSPFRRKIIHKREKERLSVFVAVQLVRTREFRNYFVDMAKQVGTMLLEGLARAKGRDVTGRVRAGFADHYIPLLHASFLAPDRLIPMAEVLSGHIWIVGVLQHDGFYTSDNPVVQRAHLNHPSTYVPGIDTPGIEIAFPVTPRVILILLERKHHRRLLHRDGRAIEFSPGSENYYNELQVLQSTRQVYFSRDDFAVAQETCKRMEM